MTQLIIYKIKGGEKIKRQIILVSITFLFILIACNGVVAAGTSDNDNALPSKDQAINQAINTNNSSTQTNTSNKSSNITISGKVKKCNDGSPFSNVTVTVSKNGKNLASTTTLEDGTYNLSFISIDNFFNVTTSYPRHKSSTKEISVISNEYNTLYGTADFQLGLTVYVSPTGDDDDAGTFTKPYKTIAKAISEVDNNGYIYLFAGTYTGSGNVGLTISKSLTIAQVSTIGSAIIDDELWNHFLFNISSNTPITVYLNGLVLRNAGRETGSNPKIYYQSIMTNQNVNLYVNYCELRNNDGAIYNGGTCTAIDSTFQGNGRSDLVGGSLNNAGVMTVSGCTFTDNTGYSGGAIYNTGNLRVSNSNFKNNYVSTTNTGGDGSAIHNRGTCTVTGSTFQNNQAQSGAIYNDYHSSLNVTGSTFSGNTATGFGGAIENYGSTCNIDKSTFTGNSAGQGGAFFNHGNSKVTSSTFTTNTASQGSAIGNGDVGNCIINFNRIINNFGIDVYSSKSGVDATNNWWGSNFETTNPLSSGFVNNNVNANPWIVLILTASPTLLDPLGTSTLTADFYHNSGGAYHHGILPIGMNVQFGVDSLGNVNPISQTLTSNQGTATFTAGANSGESRVSATVDSQTVYAYIKIGGKDELYVSANGDPLTGTGSQEHPFTTIAQAVAGINLNGVIHIASGTYTGSGNRDIALSKNMTIIGENQANTIINAQQKGQIFIIPQGVTVTIEKLTLTNAQASNGDSGSFGIGTGGDGEDGENGGAIHNVGILTLNNCILTNNAAGNSGNGGDAVGRGGNGGNGGSGGAIYNTGFLTLKNCILTNNAAGNGGNGGNGLSNNGRGGNGGNGGSISHQGVNLYINSSIINSNSAGTGGTGIYPTENGAGGGIFIEMSNNVFLRFNQIIGNTASQGSALYSKYGSVDAKNNWWGTNNDPKNIANLIGTYYSSTVDSSKCLVLSLFLLSTSSPENPPYSQITHVITGNSAKIMANLLYDNEGNYYNPLNGHVLDGIPVNFATTGGTLSQLSSTLINGQSVVGFTANGILTSSVDISTTVNAVKVSKTLNINRPPVANAGSNQNINHNTLVNLDGSGSYDPDGDTITYMWTLNKPAGSSATLSDSNSANPSFTADIPGTYTLTLTVTDTNSLTSTATITITAQNRNPIVNIGGPYTGNEASNIVFDGSASYDPDGDSLTYEWDLDNDGTFETTGATVSHTWSDNYSGTISLRVSDPYGGVSTASTTVCVDNVAPTANIVSIVKPDPLFPDIHNVIFNGNFQDPGWQDTHTVLWDFGDGTNSAGTIAEENINPDSTGTLSSTHTYTQPGTYTITLTITDKDGSIGTTTTTINVEKMPTTITVENAQGNKDQTVTLKATLKDYTNNPLNNKVIEFWIDGIKIGESTTNITGEATLDYKINQTPGKHTITAISPETNYYQESQSTSELYVPQSNLYIHITNSKNNPKIGETFILTYKLGNYGPDAAENVTITIKLPKGFELLKITGDGNWTYNKDTRTITWTLTNVPVGDPKLKIIGRNNNLGNHLFGASITSATYNLNTDGITPLSVITHASQNNTTQVNAKKAVSMQPTGVPLVALLLALLMVFGGMFAPKRKN